jgi:DnaK suppressor protein
MAQKKRAVKTAKTPKKKTVATKKSAAKKAVAKKKPATKKKAVAKKTTASNKTAAQKASPKKKTAAPKNVSPSVKSGKKLTRREKKFLEIRQTLLEQKNALLSEAESAMNALPEQTVFPDLGDQASAETDRNFMLRLRGREQRLLNKIEEAIERIDGDSFGICEACGEGIGLQRLAARPVTNLCIVCKEEQEEEEKLLAQ